MNKWTEVFKGMLDLMEMQLVQYDVGYGLIDLQGVNLGDIESDLFTTAEDIVSRLDIYVNDYYLVDLDEEYDEALKDVGLIPECVRKRSTPEGWCEFEEFARRSTGLGNARLFVENHAHQFEVMDLIANHLDEVDLHEIAEDRTTRRIAVIDEVEAELNRRYPNYQVLPRDCIERTLRKLKERYEDECRGGVKECPF